jgi:exonuclease SbcD
MARILHTADWHLGARLVEQERTDEHTHFLAWLLHEMELLRPDLLVIAGDVFDSANPPQTALAQYYSFLAGVVDRTKTEVLVLGGNHDSALTLNAPRELLRSLRIRVVGAAPEDPADGLLQSADTVVCAVPYLRERDVRQAAAGQTFEQVAAEIREGLVRHYRRALERARSVAGDRAIVATGHLTAVGANASASERPMHIGGLGAVPTDCFDGFAYVALGHFHRPQCVGSDRIRYSGSPLALGFDEADSAKEVTVIDVSAPDQVVIQPVPIPCFRSLLRLKCRMGALAETLSSAVSAGTDLQPWVELTIEDGSQHPDVDREVRAVARNHPITVLKLIVPQAEQANGADDAFAGRVLAEIRPEEVFAERLRRGGIEPSSEVGIELMGTFAELLSKMQDAQSVHPIIPAK